MHTHTQVVKSSNTSRRTALTDHMKFKFKTSQPSFLYNGEDARLRLVKHSCQGPSAKNDLVLKTGASSSVWHFFRFKHNRNNKKQTVSKQCFPGETAPYASMAHLLNQSDKCIKAKKTYSMYSGFRTNFNHVYQVGVHASYSFRPIYRIM